MQKRKIPMRMCVGCSAQKPKGELIRVVKTPDGEIIIDKKGKANGRGAYICDNIDCLNKAIKAKRFERTFETEIGEDIYNSLKKDLTENDQ